MKELLIIAILIALNGLFSMSETALISARKTRLAQESKRGSKAARTALDIINDPDSFLSAIQIGITLIGILTGLYSGATLADEFARMLNRWGVSAVYSHEIAQTTIVVAVTYLSIVIGELVPKRIALDSADTIAKLVARPMKLLSRITLPLIWLLSVSTNALVRLLHLHGDENRVTEGDVKQIIENGAASGEVQPVERDIMTRALVMGDQRVSSIMTSRKEIVSLNTDMSAAQIKDLLKTELHDTYPVIDPDQQSVKGTVRLKDLIFTIDSPDFSLRNVMSKGYFIPECMTVYDALERIKTEHSHCLVVCDEFGMMQGVITPGDILDALVGNCSSANEKTYIRPLDDGTSYIVDAACPVYEFLNRFGCEELYHPGGYATIGGLILDITRKIPSEGEDISWQEFTFKVIDMDGSYIDKLLVKFNGNSCAADISA
ncbi:MAG: hemolysin family protein [Muribaculaceae bacterium]|nr:hemolysin family protein [Muribaculaceae bacterium]MDE6332542.1 hemolysin family protein [Muribaculaceae bacterium]